MADVLTVADLEAAKKHDTFHGEVITGKAGAVSGGADIDTATNAVTGQVQTTLPKVLRDVGFKPASFTFVTGGTLGVTDADKCIYNPAPAGDNNWYSWSGALPHTVSPGTDPTVVGSGYVPRTDVVLRNDLESNGQTIDQIGTQTAIHHSGRVGYASLPRLMSKFVDYNDATRPEIQILGLGSSVGNGASLPDSVNQCPVGYFTAQLNAKMNKLGNKLINKYNRSVDGSSMITGITALIDALAEPLTPSLVVIAYGMNDGATAAYNAGQAYSNVYAYTREVIRRAKNAGSDVVVLTSPHPHTGRTSFSMPAGVSQLYPTSVPSPVPDESLVPPVSKSKPVINAAGDGFMMPVSYRHMRVNEAMRDAAASMGCPVIDAEWYWFKAVEKYGQDALYNAGEQVHPNLLGHQQSYWKAIDDFIDTLSTSVISGNQQNDFCDRQAIGTNSPLAKSHIKQVDASEVIHRVESTTGRGFKVDESGNVSPLETIDSVWKLPRTTKKTFVYPGGTPVGNAREIMGMAFNISGALVIHTTVTNSATEVWVRAINPGIGAGWQIMKFMVNNMTGTLTLQSEFTMGNAIATASVSGADIILTPSAANSSFTYEIRDLYLS